MECLGIYTATPSLSHIGIKFSDGLWYTLQCKSLKPPPASLSPLASSDPLLSHSQQSQKRNIYAILKKLKKAM